MPILIIFPCAVFFIKIKLVKLCILIKIAYILIWHQSSCIKLVLSTIVLSCVLVVYCTIVFLVEHSISYCVDIVFAKIWKSSRIKLKKQNIIRHKKHVNLCICMWVIQLVFNRTRLHLLWSKFTITLKKKPQKNKLTTDDQSTKERQDKLKPCWFFNNSFTNPGSHGVIRHFLYSNANITRHTNYTQLLFI